MKATKHLSLFFLTLLLYVTAGCSDFLYQQMNDPARDEWQQPKAVIQALDIAPGSHVADLGAGGGYFTFWLADAVGPKGRVYAVDTDEASLTFIDNAVRQRGSPDNIELVLATPNNPRLLPDKVDLIFICNTYHHLPERVTYFRSLSTSLRPSGRIAIIDYKDTGWAGFFGHATDKATIRQELESAGYRLIKDFDFLPRQHFVVFALNTP